MTLGQPLSLGPRKQATANHVREFAKSTAGDKDDSKAQKRVQDMDTSIALAALRLKRTFMSQFLIFLFNNNARDMSFRLPTLLLLFQLPS